MAYARFGQDGSDVYLYDDNGTYHCCMCSLYGHCSLFYTLKSLLSHLALHKEAGDNVPKSLYKSVFSERL